MPKGDYVPVCIFVCLQGVVIQADILEGAVLHPEAIGDGSDIHKAKPLVQVSGVDVVFHHSVELHQGKAQSFCLSQAVRHQLFTDMTASAVRIYRIAGIGNMPQPSEGLG